MIYTMVVKCQAHAQQYRLHAYVCGPGCVQWSHSIGTVSFEWIYLNRPMDCRYAVAGSWSVPKHGEEIIVWDLFDTHISKAKGRLTLVPPKPRFEVDDLDAAVMATSLLYNESDE